jgi:hypothetical protein
MNLDEDEIYTKIVVFEEISSIFFSFEVIFEFKKSIYYPDLNTVD